MKRFLAFAGSDYYPGGGWRDHCGSADSLEAALTLVINSDTSIDWAHVVDTGTGAVTVVKGRTVPTCDNICPEPNQER